MTNKIPLLIDTDPGVDDALAILMALNEESVQVVGLTIAAGNVGLNHTVNNALKLLDVCGREDVPVFAGCAEPFVFPSVDAADVHGADGFGDTGYDKSTRKAEDEHAALAIIRLSHEHANELTFVALGPLTNVALALKLDPTLPSRIKRFIVMGGAVPGHGNITHAAEFNIHFDPEAAHVVFSGFPMTEVVDWEATVAHGLPHDEIDQWCLQNSERAKFYNSISRKTRDWGRGLRGDKDWHSADSLAMMAVLEPSSVTKSEDRPLVIETQGAHARGTTLVDWNRQTGKPDNARIVLDIDRNAFYDRVKRALGAG